MSTKKVRKTHTAEFKAETQKLADKIAAAARGFNLLKKAATYFAKNQK